MRKEPTMLKKVMKERHLTMEALANMAGVKKRTLEPYTVGKRGFNKANFEFVLRLADALELDPHEFLSND